MHRLHRTSRLEFYDLSYREEDGAWLIGRPETGEYIRTTKAGHDVLRAAKAGLSVRELEERFPAMRVDRFLHELIHEGFVKRLDHHELPDHHRERFKKLFRDVSPQSVQWLYRPAAQLLSLLLILVGGALLVTRPALWPRSEDFFFTRSLMLLLPLSFLVGWLLVFLHELGHYFAARSYGLLTRFGITNRYFYIVAITDVTNVYSLERHQRYRVMMGGMQVDAIIMSLAAVWLTLVPFGAAFAKYLVLLSFWGLIWQFLFFLRTDLYYVLENALDVHNLHEKASRLLRRTFLRAQIILHYDTPRESLVTFLYSILFVGGYGFLTAWLVVYSLPITLGLFDRVATQLFLFSHPKEYLDALVFLLITLLNYVIYSTVVIHERLRQGGAKLLAMCLLLLGEFGVVFLLATAAIVTVRGELLLGLLLFLLGLAFPMPIQYLWHKEHPHGALRWELVSVLAVVSVVYLVVLRTLLHKFIAVTQAVTSPDAAIVAFLCGALAAAVYSWGHPHHLAALHAHEHHAHAHHDLRQEQHASHPGTHAQQASYHDARHEPHMMHAHHAHVEHAPVQEPASLR